MFDAAITGVAERKLDVDCLLPPVRGLAQQPQFNLRAEQESVTREEQN